MAVYDLTHVSVRNFALVLGLELPRRPGSRGTPPIGEAHDCLSCLKTCGVSGCSPRIKVRIRGLMREVE